MVRSELLFPAKMDNNVVFPAPEGPIIANIEPGWQYPLLFERIYFYFMEAPTFYHVKVVYNIGS